MKVLQVVEERPYYNYLLKTEQDKLIYLTFGFCNLEKPVKGDRILISEELLDKKNESYSQPYFFELAKDITVQQVKETNNKEYIVLKRGGEFFVLKRIYG